MKSWPSNHGKRTGQEIPLPLEAANQELLMHIYATADPGLTLAEIMAMNSPVSGGLDTQEIAVRYSLQDPEVEAAQAEGLSDMPLDVLKAVSDGLQKAARTPALPENGQMCAVFAVDIVGSTRPDRDDEIRLYLRQKSYEFLQKAFDDSGIPWNSCFREDRGDGALIVMPPYVAVKGIIDPLPERLRSLIRRHNHVSCDAAGLQLRAAAHIGPVGHDGFGFVGADVNFLFRMLEARPLKRMLADSGAELALVVSDFVYHSLVCRYPSLVHPATFQTVRFQTKNTRARAWTYIPGYAAAAAGS